MKNLKAILIATAMMVAGPLMAQHTESGYFTEGYLFRHNMNPAFGCNQDYFSMPILGNLNVDVHGTLDTRDILHIANGHMVLYTHPDVSPEKFLSGLKEKNRVGANFSLQIVGFGFKAFGGYNTFSINTRANADSNIPKSIFQLSKEGAKNDHYNIKDMRAHSDSYVEVAFGHSHPIGDKWRIGGKAKFLVGIENVDAYFDRAELTFDGEDWWAITNATVLSNMAGLNYETTTTWRGPEGYETEHTYVSGINYGRPGIGGFGAAFDLGLEYKPIQDLTISASVLDLGFIVWKNNMKASSNGDAYFSLDKYVFNASGDADNSFEREWDRVLEGLAELYELDDCGDQGKRVRMLGFTTKLGVEYALPMYRKLSFGLLGTARIQGPLTAASGRLSVNWKPVKVFSMGANVAYGTYGFEWGWIIDVHPNGFNFFLAMDAVVGKMMKQGIPLRNNIDISMGINFPFKSVADKKAEKAAKKE